MSPTLVAQRVEVRLLQGKALDGHFPWLAEYLAKRGAGALGRHPGWLAVLRDGLGHVPYCLEARDEGKTCGVLPLAYVKSWLFGRYLVSLPYLNSGGVVAEDDATARRLIDEAVKLADRLRVKHLGLRHEKPLDHPALAEQSSGKVHMRLALPGTAGKLWDGFDAKVRNQVRKGQKNGLTAAWGGAELLPEFYAVFSQNMRDLGTPVYGERLFRAVLRQFPGQAELCVMRAEGQAVAAALLLHGRGVTEVPSASSLRAFNHTNANMLMYWNLLQRACERGQAVFDFGRSSPDSSTYKFKKQWGAKPEPAVWQFYRRGGQLDDVRPDNPRYQRLIRLWQKLPLRLANWLGPKVVRGIP
jgi:FemAB-related protein (PEP-CTERM system-associated)